MTNLGLIDYNKRFLYTAVGAPRSTHDARLLKVSSICSNILNGNVIPDRVVQLRDFGVKPLVTIGVSAFQQFTWLIKAYNENRRVIRKIISASNCVARELLRKMHMTIGRMIL